MLSTTHADSRVRPPGAAHRIARRAVFPLTEWTWRAACLSIGWTLRPEHHARRWSARGNDRVLVVAPHPDDETVSAGGTIALHVTAQDRVTIVVVSDGGASHAGGLTQVETVERREREVRSAIRILGVSHIECLRLPEGKWAAAEAERELGPRVADSDLIYAPTCVDFHPEHVAVARVLASLVRPSQTIRGYEVGVPLTPALVNLVADIRDVAARKASALAAYTSQLESIRPLLRLARYQATLYRVPAVEVFWEMRGDAYTAISSAGDWRGRASPYRGIRPWPLADPLCAVAGWPARRMLRRLAAAM